MRSRFCTNVFENQVSNPGSRSLLAMLNHCTISDPEILGDISVYNLWITSCEMAVHIRRSSLVHNFNHIAPHRAILPAPFSVEASAPFRIVVRSWRMLVRSPVISLNRMTHGAVPQITPVPYFSVPRTNHLRSCSLTCRSLYKFF